MRNFLEMEICGLKTRKTQNLSNFFNTRRPSKTRIDMPHYNLITYEYCYCTAPRVNINNARLAAEQILVHLIQNFQEALVQLQLEHMRPFRREY